MVSYASRSLQRHIAVDRVSAPVLGSDVAAVPAHDPAASDHAFSAIARQTAWGLAGTGIAMALAFAVKVLLTRKMAPEDMGIVLSAQALAGLMGTVAGLGMPDAVVRFVGRSATSNTAPLQPVHAAAQTAVIATVAAAAVLLLAGTIWTPNMRADAWWAAAVFIGALPLLSAGDVIGAAYIGAGQLRTKTFLIDVGRPLCIAAALLLLPTALTQRAAYVAGLFALSACVTLAALWTLFWRDGRWRDDATRVSSESMLRFGAPLAVAALLAGPVINNVLPLMLSAWSGTATVAFYSVALSLYALVYLPVAVLENALVPGWSRAAAEDDSAALAASYRRYSRLSFSATAGVGLVVIAYDRTILVALFGPAFEGANMALRAAVLATLCSALAGPSEGMLQALGHSRTILHSRLVGSLFGAALGAYLIPMYGLAGAIAGFAAVIVTINGLYAAMLYRHARLHPFTLRTVTTVSLVLTGALAATVTTPSFPAAGHVLASVIAFGLLMGEADIRLAVRHVLGR